MPLPNGSQPWPPEPLQPVFRELSIWDAWYAGDPDELARIYGGTTGRTLDDRPSQRRGGIVGKVARWFWGQPTPPGEKRTKLHIPVAGDIASTSADLLFSEPPKITAEDNATQNRLEQIADDGLHATLLEAGEVQAALGGVYLRGTWDRDLFDRPWLAPAHADAAVPEFRWGALRAVTFWRVLLDDNGHILRHLERHEPGAILHGLYMGDRETLGRRVPLTEHEATEPLADAVDDGDTIPTGVDRLTAVYVPNMRPARRWRSVPAAAHLGRSDLAGVEGLMDALDETYSSWMRDIRLAKGRVHVPASYLENMGPGQGAAWDADREVYAALNTLDSGKEGLHLSANQFDIRVQEHRDTAADLLAQILRSAGYSAQTFGEEGDGAAVTATEIHARQRRSFVTRGRKLLYWRPQLAAALDMLLAIDREVFGATVTPQRPEIEFGDSVQENPAQLAETAELLNRAESASTYTRVQMVHPDWDDEQIREEVDRIAGEREPSAPDPDEFRGGLADRLNAGQQQPDDEQQ